jgi:hypothetical protein
LEQHITFGEATLHAGDHLGGSKANNTSSNKSGKITLSQYKNAADHTFLCMYGPKHTRQHQDIDKTNSQAYLDILKKLLKTEKDRMHEWIRRSEMGLEQVWPRTAIMLE